MAASRTIPTIGSVCTDVYIGLGGGLTTFEAEDDQSVPSRVGWLNSDTHLRVNVEAPTIGEEPRQCF